MSTQQWQEFLNELRLAEGNNCLLFVVASSPEDLEQQMKDQGLNVELVEIGRNTNPLETLVEWATTSKETVYLLSLSPHQQLQMLGYLNLHRDLFADIKRPVVIAGGKHDIKEMSRYAPDLYRFRSRTYDLTKEEAKQRQSATVPTGDQEGWLSGELEDRTFSDMRMRLGLTPFKAETENELREEISVDRYLLDVVKEGYKKAELFMSLSLCYFKLGDAEQGQRYFDEAKRIKEEEQDYVGIGIVWGEMGRFWHGQRQFQKALEFYGKALSILPEDSPYRLGYYFGRAACYYFTGQLDEALQDVNVYLELNPHYDFAYMLRGWIYVNLRQHRKATDDYNKSIQLAPEDSNGYFWRGNACRDLGKYEEALRDYDKSIELAPEDHYGYLWRGHAYRELGEYEKALRDYEKSIELAPEDPYGYLWRGNTYEELGKYEKAREDFSEAKQLFDKRGDSDQSRFAQESLEALGNPVE